MRGDAGLVRDFLISCAGYSGWKNTCCWFVFPSQTVWLHSVWQRLSAPSGIFKWVSAGNKHSCAVNLQALHPHLFVSMHMFLFRHVHIYRYAST